ERAARCLAAAQARVAEVGHTTRLAAQVQFSFGELHLRRRDYLAAERAFGECLRILRASTDEFGEAFAQVGLGAARAGLRRARAAEESLLTALALARRFGERLVEARALLALGTLADRRLLAESLNIFEELGARSWRDRARTAIAAR